MSQKDKTATRLTIIIFYTEEFISGIFSNIGIWDLNVGIFFNYEENGKLCRISFAFFYCAEKYYIIQHE